MGELEDKINAVLSDPQQMAEISRLAQSLMGTGPTNAPTETAEPSGQRARYCRTLAACWAVWAAEARPRRARTIRRCLRLCCPISRPTGRRSCARRCGWGKWQS